MHFWKIDRRRFIRAAGAAGAAWGLAGALGASGAEKSGNKRIKKSLKFGMVKTGGTLVEKFKLLKRVGFDGVELDSPNNFTHDEVLRARDESGLVIPGVIDSVHWRQRLSDPDPAMRAAGVEALKTALRDVKAYGGTSVLLVPGKVDAQANYEQCWERSQAEVRKAIPLAEELGIYILFENVWNDFLTDASETARYVDQFKSKWVGAYFDVGNAVRYAPPAQWIRTLGKRIVKLDIKEFSLTKAKEDQRKGFQVKIGEGDCNWPEVMKALGEIGYTGWGSAEVAGGDEARLKEISERMDRVFAA